MNKKCAICGKTHDLFELKMKTDDGEEYFRWVCGSCWEIIFAIAQKAVLSALVAVTKGWNLP